MIVQTIRLYLGIFLQRQVGPDGAQASHKECEFISIIRYSNSILFDFTLRSLMLIAGGTHLELVRKHDSCRILSQLYRW